MTTDLHQADLASDVAAAQRAKIEQLRLRRASSAAPSRRADPVRAGNSTPAAQTQSRGRSGRRPHPAQNARIAAAGLGVATMFGLIGVMGYAQSSTAAAPAAVVVAPAPQVTVVIHRNGTASTVATTGAATAPVTATVSAPIALTAQPTVRQAPAAPAPKAQTNGSR